jgi:hypothetical protein
MNDLLNLQPCERWVLHHFHPEGLRCSRCGAAVAEAHKFRRTRKSKLIVYRCNRCKQTYNLYSGTIFHQRHLTPYQAMRLVCGVLKGEPANMLAAELCLHYTTVLELRRDLQKDARWWQPAILPSEYQAATDKRSQNAEK